MNMIWEGDIAPFAKAIVAAQKATEAVYKSATNPAFKSKYADLAAVVEAVYPALNDNGIAVLQGAHYDGEFLSVETVLLHESGARVSSTLAVRPSKSDPQGLGSATTYARRYSLLAMTGAAPEDDDGNAASGPREAATSKPVKTISQNAADDLEALLEMTGTDKVKFLAYYKITRLADMPETDLDHAVAMLKKKVA